MEIKKYVSIKIMQIGVFYHSTGKRTKALVRLIAGKNIVVVDTCETNCVHVFNGTVLAT